MYHTNSVGVTDIYTHISIVTLIGVTCTPIFHGVLTTPHDINFATCSYIAIVIASVISQSFSMDTAAWISAGWDPLDAAVLVSC